MNRPLHVVVLTSLMFFGTPAHAVDSTTQPTMSKRRAIVQMIDCMKKQKSADKSGLYEEAVKVCKERVPASGNDA